ncbi:hypothetical protein B4O97_03635 [Marispirochaeta aestuarii]|uniref:HTH cro/C1-type domain-containing protein n=2 Tax=Marispirochaeta aestuarii TaxID=1963862 RepID=A0A1Y1S2V6_9SPIO|nr:hypothetical protein B4O97_03635 [Marispirochaeta aestuarii]
MDFLDRVKIEVRKQKITQEWLAEKAGISYSTFKGWKSKGRVPNVYQAVDIAKILGTSVEYLVTGSSGGKSDQRIKIERFIDLLSDSEIERAQIILEASFPNKKVGWSEGSAM